MLHTYLPMINERLYNQDSDFEHKVLQVWKSLVMNSLRGFTVCCNMFLGWSDCHSLFQNICPRLIQGDRSVSLLVKRAAYIIVQLLSSIAVAGGTVLRLLWPQLFVANYSRLCFEECTMLLPFTPSWRRTKTDFNC